MRVRSEVPVGVAAFVGRETERAQVAGLVTDARVVTLIGSGGCGKTRLALETAGDMSSQFAEGSCWVELQGASDPATVAAAVGGAVGVWGRPEQTLVDALAEQLRERHLLVVLDNCEHLVTACAALVRELTSACPRLHVLATSREPLAVEGETTFGVAPLRVPDLDERSARTVGATDAGRLFEVRARQVRPNFTLSDDNAAAVGTICRRLDGIPLAIELAAARVRVLAPSQIATGLADRFRLLTGGDRSAPARQRSLEASVAWSFELLSDTERSALARLSVFAGTFDLEGAEAVVAGPEVAEPEVLDLVIGLADRSLLQVAEQDGLARYRLLETVRLFASERLAELDDASRVRDRHLAFFIGLAGRAQAGLNSGQPETWVARLTADLDDLRAAMDWAAASGNLRGLVDLTEPIVRFWFERGLSGEMHRRLHAAVDSPGASDGERARGLITAALVAVGSGEPARAYDSACQAVDASRPSDIGAVLTLGLSVRAAVGVMAGRSTSEQAAADVEEAVQHAERCDDAAVRAYALQFAAQAVILGGTIDAGCRLLEQSIEVCEAGAVAFHLPSSHALLGLTSVYSGRLDRARHHARRGRDLARQVGRPGWEAVGLTALGASDVLQGDHGQANRWLTQAQETLVAALPEGSFFESVMRPWLALSAYASGDLDAAREAATEMTRIGRDCRNRWEEAMGEWLLGVLAHLDERHAEARAHLETSHALSTDPRLPRPLGRSSLGLAELAKVGGDIDHAWELAHDALEVLADYGDRLGAAAALEAVADLAAATGKPEKALRLLAASERFHAETGIARFPFEAGRFVRARDAARAALDDTDATACLVAGGRLSLKDAVGYARRGRGERVRPESGWASLTPTEEEVVRLVTEGLTNAEVGKRLFVSVHTVKKHLSHAYAKVGLDSRAELVAQAARRDL